MYYIKTSAKRHFPFLQVPSFGGVVPRCFRLQRTFQDKGLFDLKSFMKQSSLILVVECKLNQRGCGHPHY